MIYVYAAEAVGLPDPRAFPKCMEGLSDVRKEKIMRKISLEGRRECLAASLLLKEVLQRFGHTLEEIAISENGKPLIKDFYFNLSHSHGMAVCAVSVDEVGCDVEKIGVFRENVENKICSEREKVYLNMLSGDARVRQFYRAWTRKESYVKMTGEGIRFPLSRVEFFEEKIYREGQQLSCNYKEYELGEFVISVCGKEREFAPLEIVRISERN